MRMNEDVENDYAFTVKQDDTVSSRFAKIFDPKEGLTKYMVLRPSIFYKNVPIGFRKSNHPGFLTENGCLLFDYDADNKKYLEDLKDSEKSVWEQLWPGQLVLPKWEKDWNTIFTYLAVMLVWLYTDLPDCVSPTPGICLTNQLSKNFAILSDKLGFQELAGKLRDEIRVNQASVTTQWLFFVMHIFKLLVITAVFYSGLVNPLSFNPWRTFMVSKTEISGNNVELKTTLKNIGWVGARRAIYDDYRDTYYKYRIEKAGGAVLAYKSGVMKIASKPGVKLSAGEGFQTDLENRFNKNTFETMKTAGKFILSEDYFLQLEHDLKENIKKCNGDIAEINNEIRRFRKYGLFECGPELSELVALRRKVEETPAPEPLPEQEKKEQ